jgi:hypothetical protein
MPRVPEILPLPITSNLSNGLSIPTPKLCLAIKLPLLKLKTNSA